MAQKLSEIPYKETESTVMSMFGADLETIDGTNFMDMRVAFARWFRRCFNDLPYYWELREGNFEKVSPKRRDEILQLGVIGAYRTGVFCAFSPAGTVSQLLFIIHDYEDVPRPIHQKMIDALLTHILELPKGWQFGRYALRQMCWKQLRSAIRLEDAPEEWTQLSDKERQARLFLAAACIQDRDPRKRHACARPYLEEALELMKSIDTEGKIDYQKLLDLPKTPTYYTLCTEYAPIIWETLNIPYAQPEPLDDSDPGAPFLLPSPPLNRITRMLTLYDELKEELADDFVPPPKHHPTEF